MKIVVSVLALFLVNVLILPVLFEGQSTGGKTVQLSFFPLAFSSLVGSVLGLLIGEVIKWFFRGFVFVGKAGDLAMLKLGFMFGFHIIASLFVAFLLVIQLNVQGDKNKKGASVSLSEMTATQMQKKSINVADDMRSSSRENLLVSQEKQAASESVSNPQIFYTEVSEETASPNTRESNGNINDGVGLTEYLSKLNIDEVRKKAKDGDMESQYELGMMNKLGVKKKKSKFFAKKWLRKSAKQGHKKAQEELSNL